MLRSLLFVAIALVLIMGVAALVGMVTFHLHKRRLLAIAATRRGVSSWAHFQVDFPDWPESQLRRMYDEILILIGVSDFPLMPDDHLFHLLEIDQDDLDDLLEAELLRRNIDPASIQEKMPVEPIQTVRDMLNWISQLTQIKDKPDGAR